MIKSERTKTAVYGVIMRLFVLLNVIVWCFLLAACSSQRPQGKTEAEVLYKEAEQLVEKDRYLLATEKLNLIRSQYPYSYYATHAELLSADILFKQESYVEAAAAYIMFKDFHPKHQKMAYVYFRIAESFYNQLPATFDRDLSSGVEAIKYYEYLKNNFSKSKYSKDADKKIRRIGKMQEDKEQYIADFYYKTKDYDAAVYRYKSILNQFSQPVLRKHSMERIVLASYHQENFSDCKRYANNFARYLKAEQKSRVISLGQKCQDKLVKK